MIIIDGFNKKLSVINYRGFTVVTYMCVTSSETDPDHVMSDHFYMKTTVNNTLPPYRNSRFLLLLDVGGRV